MPVFNNILAGASAQGGADLGAPIEQSLRFINPNLTNLEATLGTPTDRDRWSWSCWVKRGKISLSHRTTLFAAAPGSGLNDNNRLDLGFEHTDELFFTSQNQTASSAGKYRDPSAWMHVAYTWDGTTLKCYANGVRQFANTALSGDVGINGAVSHRIGRSAASAEWFFEGYIAEMNFLDGTLVGESTVDGEILIDEFGRYNADGVWVPKAIGFTSDQYGNNGFRLTFASDQHATASTAIGIDSAPTGGNHNSANNFTASGFDTNEMRVYSQGLFTVSDTPADSTGYLTATGRSWTAGTADHFFDGTGSEVRATQNVVLRFDPAIPNVTKVECNTERLGTTNWFNGTAATSSSVDNSATHAIYDSSSINLTSIVFGGNASLGTNYKQIHVTTNGTRVQLLDNGQTDVDFKDTPTKNYATLNPIQSFQSNPNQDGTVQPVTYSAANLQCTSTNSGQVGFSYATINPHDIDKVYFETGPWLSADEDNYPGVVLGNLQPMSTTRAGHHMTDLLNTGNWRQHVGADPSNATEWNQGDVASWKWDATNLALAQSVNNSAFTSFDLGASGAGNIPHNIEVNLGLMGTLNDGVGTINFGQMGFNHSIPTDYKELHTDNLPEPTIKNGKDYFDVVTYTGTGSGTKDLSTSLNFRPDMVWIKSTSHSTNHALFDSVREPSGGYLDPSDNLTAATTNGTLSSFDDKGFTVGAATGAEWANGGSRDYVAWCWKAGGAPTADNTAQSTAMADNSVSIDGKLETGYVPHANATRWPTKISANTTAGFSIVEYASDGNASKYPHALGKEPKFMIVKRRDGTGSFEVYHKSMGNNGKMEINVDSHRSSFGTSQVYWDNTTPDANTFSLGGGGDTNTSGENGIAYIWAEITGFSKFGSFVGNGVADGPFIYCGFKPRLVVIKREDGSSGSWFAFDSKRETVNCMVSEIHWDTAAQPNTANQNEDKIDFLSNGFKLRSSRVNYNATNTIIFMAWAEHPFGGENTPPATAR